MCVALTREGRDWERNIRCEYDITRVEVVCRRGFLEHCNLASRRTHNIYERLAAGHPRWRVADRFG